MYTLTNKPKPNNKKFQTIAQYKDKNANKEKKDNEDGYREDNDDIIFPNKIPTIFNYHIINNAIRNNNNSKEQKAKINQKNTINNKEQNKKQKTKNKSNNMETKNIKKI